MNDLKTQEDEDLMAREVEDLKRRGMTTAEAMVELKLMTKEEAGIENE